MTSTEIAINLLSLIIFLVGIYYSIKIWKNSQRQKHFILKEEKKLKQLKEERKQKAMGKPGSRNVFNPQKEKVV